MQTVYLINLDELRSKGRSIARSLTWDDLYPYVEEAQTCDLKRQFGDQIYIDIIDYLAGTQTERKYDVLLNGGRYKDSCGNDFIFEGLKTALTYYVIARLTKSLNFDISRFGMNSKNDQYSSMTEAQQRKIMENDARRIADIYFGECLRYLQAFPEMFPFFGCTHLKQRTNNRSHIIGD